MQLFVCTESTFDLLHLPNDLSHNSVIIYSPSSCFKPVWISFFCWTHKGRYFEEWQ